MAADLLSRVLDLDRAPLYNRITMAKARKQRISVGEAQGLRRRSRARAQPEAGLGRVPPRDAPLLSARRTGVARAGLDRHRGSRRRDRARQRRHRDEFRRGSVRTAGPGARLQRRAAERLRLRGLAGARAGREPHADHRSESAIRGRAALDTAIAKTSAQDRLDRRDESLHRRHSGDGQLSGLRSQRSARTAGKRRRARAAIWRLRRRSSPAACSR